MSARNILFVETDGSVLQGLMRTLTGFNADWQIVLSNDADAALEMMTQRRFCMVVAGFSDSASECERFL